MRKSAMFAISFAMALPVLAGEKSLKSVGLEASDLTGCYLSNGREIVGPTIGLMVAVYDDPQTNLSKEDSRKVMLTAIEAGCNLHEADRTGLSPLNAAILFNHPELVSLLLSKGADPNSKIVSPKAALNGLDSYQFVDFLKSRKRDRPEIKKMLIHYSGN